MIRNYISSINWKGDWSINKIQEDLHNLLGETPAVDIDYKKDVMLNEVTNEAKEIENVDKISIVYTSEKTDKITKLELSIE